MKGRVRGLAAVFCVLFVTACEQAPSAAGHEESSVDQGNAATRWYNEAQVATGASVFADNCAVCHGSEAQGTAEDWRQRLDDGSFPPPPLNGSAHAWHHNLPVLLQVIREGGSAWGGKMPPFAGVLTESEQLAAIAWFQHFWSDEIYAQWERMGGAN